MSGKILVTLSVVGALALGIGLVHPVDVAAQVPSVKTKLNYINSNGAIGKVDPTSFESAFTVSPNTVFLLTDIILTNISTAPVCAKIFDAAPGETPFTGARARTPDLIVPSEDTVVISLATALDFLPGQVVQVQNCLATDSLEYLIRGYNVRLKKFRPSDEQP
jgi:hypothetical protein